MKLTDILKSEKCSLSFEVFPPKTDDNFESVKNAVREIATLKPTFMSVTYGAGGGTSKYTLDIAKEIKMKHGVSTLAHLTCVSSTRETVRARIADMKAAGIENVMALRGEGFCIGGACYPEVHPESINQKEDIKYLKEKVDAGCEFLTTQMFFDNNLLYNFLYKIREAGITVPVIAGIMPITNAKQVERAMKLSGSFMPQRFKSIVDKFGSDPAAMKQAGIAYATDQIIDLFANNVTNVHVYSMNKPDVAFKVQENLSDILGK